jgi:hypothetical protein
MGLPALTIALTVCVLALFASALISRVSHLSPLANAAVTALLVLVLASLSVAAFAFLSQFRARENLPTYNPLSDSPRPHRTTAT